MSRDETQTGEWPYRPPIDVAPADTWVHISINNLERALTPTEARTLAERILDACEIADAAAFVS